MNEEDIKKLKEKGYIIERVIINNIAETKPKEEKTKKEVEE